MLQRLHGLHRYFSALAQRREYSGRLVAVLVIVLHKPLEIRLYCRFKLLPAALYRGLAPSGEIPAAALQHGGHGIADVHRRHRQQQPYRHQRKYVPAVLRQAAEIIPRDLPGGQQRVVVAHLVIVYQPLNVRSDILRLVIRAELEYTRREPYHLGGGVLHIVGDVAAVRPGIGQQLVLIELLGAVQRLLRGVAVQLVRVALERCQIVKLRRIRILLLLRHRFHDRGFSALRRSGFRLQRRYLIALRLKLSEVQLQCVVPRRSELLYLLLALHQHGKGGGLDSSHGKQAAVLHREQLRRIHADYPVRLVARESAAVKRVVVAARAQVLKSLPDRLVRHGAYPQP